MANIPSNRTTTPCSAPDPLATFGTLKTYRNASMSRNGTISRKKVGETVSEPVPLDNCTIEYIVTDRHDDLTNPYFTAPGAMVEGTPGAYILTITADDNDLPQKTYASTLRFTFDSGEVDIILGWHQVVETLNRNLAG